MNRLVWIIVGAVIAVALIYVLYNAQNTSSKEAGREIEQAVESTGDYMEDTANKVKRDLER